MFVLLAAILLSACQLDASRRWPYLVARRDTPTATLTPAPTPTSTATITPTPPPTATFTPAPTPTATPISSERLVLAEQAYTNGDYETARREFSALLTDPGADAHEKRLALHWRGRSELELGEATAAIETLKMFVQRYPGDELTRAAQFNLGRAYEQAGGFQEAIAAYRDSVLPDDPINVYVYQRIGDVGLLTAAYTDTIAAYQAGIDSTADLALQHLLREGIAQAELSRQNPDGAIAQYEAILNESQDGDYRAKILRLAGEAYLVKGDTEAAYQRYQEAVNNYPEAYDSYLALVELVDAQAPVDEFQRGLVDYYAGAYQPAIAAFERYLTGSDPLTSTMVVTSTLTITDSTAMTTSTTSSPGRPTYAADALWLMGLSWKNLGGYSNAIAAFQELIDEYSGNANWGKAHLEIGEALAGQNEISRAKAAYRAFAAENPAHPLAGEALWRAGRLELDGDLLAEAHDSLRELASAYPGNEYADDALYWAGRAAYLMDDLEKAAAAWGELATGYPNSELASFGGYWQAKALLELGQNEEAKVVAQSIVNSSLNYYSLRARDLLTGSQPHPVPLALPSPAQVAQERSEAEAWLAQWLDLENTPDLSVLSASIQSDPAFQRGRALLDIGLRDLALAEFEKVKDRWWNDPLVMAQLSVYFRDKNMGMLSVGCAARVIFLSPANVPERAPMFIQRLFYPILFPDLIFAEADKYNLDPALLLSIMRQESLFEQSAESIAGARGLMQVMPATGQYVAERSDFGSFNPDQLWLPHVSVKFGAWYINQQLDIFDENQFAALAAYNAGPGNVLEWVKVSEDLDIFVESIPYWESRTYIRNIYVNLAAYRRVYGTAG